MKQKWLNKQNNKECILFFNGWGADESVVSGVDYQGFDLCVFFSYSNFEADFSSFAKYTQLYLVGWSMGVYAAAQTISKTNLEFTKKIAINGTETPIHNEQGIPEKIFSATLKKWNADSRNKFNARMLGGKKSLEKSGSFLSGRAVENQKTELEFLFGHTKENVSKTLTWNTAIVGLADLIFSAKNQHKYWDGKCRVVEKTLPHFPFIELNNWRQIINL